jgi:hypothetical protein
MIKAKAIVTVLLLVIGLLGLFPGSAQAHDDAFCVLASGTPILAPRGDVVVGTATVVCNRAVRSIVLSGFLTKGFDSIRDRTAKTCLATDRCGISLSASRGTPNKLWHVWASSTIEFGDEHTDRDPDARGTFRRSDCNRL